MTVAKDKIACLGWGSLIWDPRDFPCRGPWFDDGPLLPVEFARESGGKEGEPGDRITLVICPNVPSVRTCWALLDVPDMSAAKRSLAAREGITDPKMKAIGFWDGGSGERHGLEADTIAAWAERLGLSGAVWTNLQFGFKGKGKRNVMPGGPDVIEFLRKLDDEKRPVAEGYVRQAPAQIDTPYRRLIEKELGWFRRA